MIVLELYTKIKGYEEYYDEFTGKKSFPTEKEIWECLSLREVPRVSGLRDIGWIER